MNTLTITNFGGPLTRRNVGDINSGQAKFETSWGYDPYSKPGSLTWLEQPSSVLTLTGSAGPIAAMKQRSEGAINYVYAIAKDKTLYKIATNANNNADINSPSIVGALGVSPNFDVGGSMVFYGATEKIFIGGDNNVQRINFDGSNSSVVGGTSGSPRPQALFLGKIYFGNRNNIGEIDSTETVTTLTKLSPGLPAGVYVRNLSVSPDGSYLEITATRNLGGNTIDGNTVDTTISAANESFKFYWNGIDDGVSAIENFGGVTLNSGVSFQDKRYTFGNDINGAALFSGAQKAITFPKMFSPFPSAVLPIGNIVSFASHELDSIDNKFKMSLFAYGQGDSESPTGLFRFLRQGTGSGVNDVVAVPALLNVNNRLYVPSVWSYPGNIGGVSKVYISTTDGVASVQQLWKFSLAPTGTGSVLAGVYETQTALFSKKVAIKAVRLYTEPLVANNSFTIDLIGSGGSVMGSGSKIFTVGTNVTAGEDVVSWNPPTAPTAALGIRITNSSVLGTKNWTGLKLEVDIDDAGK